MCFFKPKNRRKGNGLMPVVLMMLMASLILPGWATNLSTIFAGSTSINLSTQARQYALLDADMIRMTGYDDVANKNRIEIPNSDGFQEEIIVGPEKVIGSDPDNKQKIIMVNIYKDGEAEARYTLKVPLSSQGSSTGSVPIGAVIAWPVATDPDGPDKNKWLECDGRAVDASKYPKLSAKMSHTPNYAGVFLRGYGSQYSSHYGSVLHQSAALGTLQGDSIRNLYGTFGAVTWFLDSSATGAFYYSDKAWGYDIEEDFGTQWNDIGIATFSATRIVPTANENRPINKAVRYLIRAA